MDLIVDRETGTRPFDNTFMRRLRSIFNWSVEYLIYCLPLKGQINVVCEWKLNCFLIYVRSSPRSHILCEWSGTHGCGIIVWAVSIDYLYLYWFVGGKVAINLLNTHWNGWNLRPISYCVCVFNWGSRGARGLWVVIDRKRQLHSFRNFHNKMPKVFFLVLRPIEHSVST